MCLGGKRSGAVTDICWTNQKGVGKREGRNAGECRMLETKISGPVCAL